MRLIASTGVSLQHIRLPSGVLAKKPLSLHSEVLYLCWGKLLMVYYFTKGYLTWIPSPYSINEYVIETTYVTFVIALKCLLFQ